MKESMDGTYNFIKHVLSKSLHYYIGSTTDGAWKCTPDTRMGQIMRSLLEKKIKPKIVLVLLSRAQAVQCGDLGHSRQGVSST